MSPQAANRVHRKGQEVECISQKYLCADGMRKCLVVYIQKILLTEVRDIR
jgi:hypothetical protein